MGVDIYLTSSTPFSGAIHLPTIKTSAIKTDIDLKDIDLVLYTSKNGVVCANSISPPLKSISSIVVGKETKKSVLSYGINTLNYSHIKSAKDMTDIVIKEHFKRKVLYVRGESISYDIKKALLKNSIFVKESIVYKSEAILYPTQKMLRKNSIIIFTSPLTAKNFLKSFSWDSSFKAVVIGETTLKSINFTSNVYMSSEISIESCIKKACELKAEC